MNAPRKTLVIGNSHTQMLTQAAKPDDPVEIHWLRKRESARFGDLPLPDAIQKIKHLQPGDLLAILHLGTFHNIIGLLNHEEPFRLTTAKGVETGALVPYQAMRAYVDEALAKDTVIPALARVARCRVVHPMPPPPKEETPKPPKSSSKAYRGRVISKAGFSPPALRLALWGVEQAVLAERLKRIGVEVLPPPEGVTTADGYLLPECGAADVTHANDRYGRRLLDQLMALEARTALASGAV